MVADRMRGPCGLLFRPAVFTVLKEKFLEADRTYFVEIGKILGGRRRNPRPKIQRQRAEATTNSFSFTRYARDAERVCRLRRDELLRDP